MGALSVSWDGLDSPVLKLDHRHGGILIVRAFRRFDSQLRSANRSVEDFSNPWQVAAASCEMDEPGNDGAKVVIGYGFQQNGAQLGDTATMRIPRPAGVAL
jgi:hypothetical protein